MKKHAYLGNETIRCRCVISETDDNGNLNEYGYHKISIWDPLDAEALMEYVKQHWRYADSGYWKRRGDIYRISTAGVSDNEYIINALQYNWTFWGLYWVSSRVGGHYLFDLGRHKRLREQQDVTIDGKPISEVTE